MSSVGVIGFGRFGKVLSNILSKGFAVKIYDPAVDSKHAESLSQEFPQVDFVEWEALFQEDCIFVAVPINRFEEVIQKMVPFLTGRHTVIDVCSVKVYPSQIMDRYLPREVGIVATHPLFGPDSYLNLQNGLKFMMHDQRPCSHDGDNRQYRLWKDFFHKQGLVIVEMTPEEHDRMAAETQGLTHYLGRLLKEYGIRKTPIDTEGFSALLHLVEQTCYDTWELYLDLQHYNPFTKKMVEKIDQSIVNLNQKAKITK